MKKLIMILSINAALLLGGNAAAQDMPAGALVNHVSCSLHDGVTMPQVVAWARSIPRNGPQPLAEFYREAAVNPNFMQNYDFLIATYYQSYSHIVEVVGSQNNAPANRLQSAVRAQDLYTCNPASNVLIANRTVSPENDGFTGDTTVMHTRFCRLAEGNDIEDAWAFVTRIEQNYKDAGNSSLMQLWSRELGPIPIDAMENTGSGVTITVVPATPQDWGTRWDLGRNGFDPLARTNNPFMACNYPAVWLTHAVYRSPAPQ
ncbi:MAG: hypothetical protein RL120_12425, partial [Gammaproteobacteria bacterium]